MLTGTLINSLELNFISAFNNLLNSFTTLQEKNSWRYEIHVESEGIQTFASNKTITHHTAFFISSFPNSY